MAKQGHFRNATGHSEFRVFAPEKSTVSVVLLADDMSSARESIALTLDALGYWAAQVPPLPDGTRYLIEIDGQRFPDIASRSQPDGVHAASAVAEPKRVTSLGWHGVRMEDAVIYELHLGTFTAEGTLASAQGKLGYLAELGITVIELLPIAAFPGQRNWGYDGTYPFALQKDYGDYADLKNFIEAAHTLGIAVLLDVVYNHFGPEGNYTAAYGPYTRSAATPWGAAVNLDREYNHGVREFFLESARYWIQDAGFDGLRMDAVSMIFDQMPVHLLRQFTDLARAIGAAEGREVLMIAEHLRNNKHVTSASGFHFHSQWNDDVNHALYAQLSGETWRHYENFGSFADVVKALDKGFVLDGTRFDKHHRYLLGTDGADTKAIEHVVHIQNHDQVGNRPFGDRMITAYGRDKSLLAITAVFASSFVPMIFMGEEYGETAPFLFFEDFGDAALIEGVRQGRKSDYDFGDREAPDPHAISTFEASKLQWDHMQSPAGQAVLDYYKGLIALKRGGELGPRDRTAVVITGNEQTRVIRIETTKTLTVLNFSDAPQAVQPAPAWLLYMASGTIDAEGRLSAFGAAIYRA